MNVRSRIDLVKKASAIIRVEYSCKAPRLILHRLDILDLHKKYISRLGCLDFKGAGEVVNSREVNILYIVRAIIIFDLAAGLLDISAIKSVLSGSKWLTQSIHSILTTSSFLIVPANGTGLNQKDLVELDVRVPSGCQRFCNDG